MILLLGILGVNFTIGFFAYWLTEGFRDFAYADLDRREKVDFWYMCVGGLLSVASLLLHIAIYKILYRDERF